MDWDRFRFDFEVDLEGILPRIISIEAYKEAALNLILPPEWREQLDRLNRIRAIHGTTALEGNTLSEEEVSHQMDIVVAQSRQVGPVNAANVSKEQLQIRNAGAAQSWVRERFYPGSAPIALSDILFMHQLITSHSDETHNVPGALRSFSVVVGSPDMGGVHRGAPHDQLPRLMKEYLEFITSRRLQAQHPVIRALLAHFFLVTIHPFGDGNGRVSRLVEAGILFQGGYNVLGFYGLSNYFYRNEHDYKMLLQESRRQHPFEVTPFIVFGVTGFASELKGINNFIKAKLNRTVYRTMLIRAFNTRAGSRRRVLNRREYSLLIFLLSETEPADPFSDEPSKKILFSELREAPYVTGAYTNVTPRTFYRELQRLADMGFIRFTRLEESKDWIVELDFNAIGKYPGP